MGKAHLNPGVTEGGVQGIDKGQRDVFPRQGDNQQTRWTDRRVFARFKLYPGEAKELLVAATHNSS